MNRNQGGSWARAISERLLVWYYRKITYIYIIFGCTHPHAKKNKFLWKYKYTGPE
jgi:hypothetical protein